MMPLSRWDYPIAVKGRNNASCVELQCEYIPAEMRGLRNPAHFVEGELYIWVFVVIEVE